MRLVMSLACVAIAFSSPVMAVVTLDASFDHASLKSYSVSGAAATPTVNLVGRDNYFGGGSWRWMNFNAAGVQNVRPTFSISDNFAGGASALNNHAMVYSYDGTTWNFFDNNARSGGQYRFSNNTSFTSPNVFVAYAPSYSYGKTVAHTQAVLATPWAAPTSSGDANGVIGQSAGGTDDLGRAVSPKDIYAYRITNPAINHPTRAKKKIVISTGLHAGETLGTHTYQGLVDFLVSDDPHAVVLRGVAEFYCYPTMNPDGRFAGNNRATVQDPNVEPNGQWHPSLWGNNKEIMENGTAMIADTNVSSTNVDAYIDFHSTIPSFPGDDFAFIEYEEGDHLAPFWQNLKQIQPNILDTDSTGSSWTSANFAAALLGAQVDITFETQFGKRRDVSYYNNMGRNFGLAFEQAYRPVAGDTNFGGDVNFTDLLKLAQNYNNTTGMTWEQGDFDFDGDVDFSDLLALAQNFGTGVLMNGTDLDEVSLTFASDWALARSLVPEPGCVLVLGGAPMMWRRRRRAS
jgi:hypothetical protein